MKNSLILTQKTYAKVSLLKTVVIFSTCFRQKKNSYPNLIYRQVGVLLFELAKKGWEGWQNGN